MVTGVVDRSSVRLRGGEWQKAADQLVKRKIMRRASVLDPPRAKPKTVRMVELSAGWDRILAHAPRWGASNLDSGRSALSGHKPRSGTRRGAGTCPRREQPISIWLTCPRRG